MNRLVLTFMGGLVGFMMGEAYAAIKDDAGFGYIVAFFGVIFLGLLIAAYRKDREERKL